MKNILLFTALLLTALCSYGQEKKWHELEGYFQSQNHKEMYVRLVAQDSMMVATALFNGSQLHLVPDTGLAFVSKEQSEHGPMRVVFKREPSGAVNQITVSDPGSPIWVRAPNYKEVVEQEMVHTPEQLQKYAGLYYLKEDTTTYLQLTVDNNSLTLYEHWDRATRANFVPSAEGKFFQKEFSKFTLDFSTDQHGQVTQFVAFGRDTWIRACKPTIGPDRYKDFEGKYRSKDDPDNEVRLIATDSGLVVKQLWDNKAIRVEGVTNSYFLNQLRAYPLHIVTDSLGKVEGILLMNRQFFNKVNE